MALGLGGLDNKLVKRQPIATGTGTSCGYSNKRSDELSIRAPNIRKVNLDSVIMDSEARRFVLHSSYLILPAAWLHSLFTYFILRFEMDQLVYDDTDPNIQYYGHWNRGGLAAEYNSTVHGANAPDAGFIFTFNGSFVAVYGTIPDASSSTNVAQASATFTLDGQTVEFSQPLRDTALYHQPLFQSAVTGDGPHTLNMNPTKPYGAALWVDYLFVTPPTSGTQKFDILSNSVDHTGIWRNKTIKGSNNNASIWLTDGHGSVTLQFKGRRVAVYGAIPRDTIARNATFSVDGKSMDGMVIPAKPRHETLFQVPIFQSPPLPNDDHHTLVIATNKTLALEFFVVDDAPPSTTVQTSSTQSPVPSIPSNTSSPTNTPNTHAVSTAIIPGSIVGAIIALMLLSILFIFLLRMWRSNKTKRSLDSGLQLSLSNLSEEKLLHRQSMKEMSHSDQSWDQLVYDNTDPRIEYFGQWETGGESAEYQQTAHGADTPGSAFSFQFDGPFVAVYGTIPSLRKENHNVTEISATFTLDDQHINFSKP
ncbi:hypothetical protein AMATHDRAFT_6170 [Amanita thiersii Skay4041]|uniref:Uncharacterized protein n=1 Tax=Amanita thiersii Skay4041 TaxID=703135 RepID=A0A2A9NAJ4_9AGAR|nr:hypothetical protein AMATHDRAFT_6170 [Amanita thiersii Skay4041]